MFAMKKTIFLGNMLITQLTREIPENVKSFDTLMAKELEALSELYSLSCSIAITGYSLALQQNNEFKISSGHLLHHALNTYVSAVNTLRSGFRIQPNILIRNLIETLATVFHLTVNQHDYEKYRKKEFKSTKAINTLKKWIPIYGQIYGFFSDKFTHIGESYDKIEPVLPYEDKKDPGLEFTMIYLRWTAWLLYVVTELVFLNLVENPRYWAIVTDNKVKYAPSMEELEWFKQFMAYDELFKGEHGV